MDLCSLGLWVWQCHHGFCRLHSLSLPFVMPEIYHEQFEQKWEHPHDTTTLETNKQAFFFWKGKECPHGPVQSLGLWVWQCHHGFCRLHRLSLPFVMPEIYHEQFEQKMGTPTRHYHHYTDESIIKSGRPMSSALISQPFSLTLPCCTGGTSFMKSNWDEILQFSIWYAGSMGRTTHLPSVWCSKHYAFHNFL